MMNIKKMEGEKFYSIHLFLLIQIVIVTVDVDMSTINICQLFGEFISLRVIMPVSLINLSKPRFTAQIGDMTMKKGGNAAKLRMPGDGEEMHAATCQNPWHGLTITQTPPDHKVDVSVDISPSSKN